MEGIGENGEISEEARDGVTQLLRRSFRPEFLNRLDEIVFYKPLTRENIHGIVDLLVADLQKRMAQKQLTVTLTDAAKDYLIAKGYDPIYGARPLKRLIQTEVETLLARWIIAEDPAACERFLAEVDAAAVYANASTRFTDGGEFGLGAEIGISTQKLHARGPFAAEALTTYKYVVRGTGQVRP